MAFAFAAGVATQWCWLRVLRLEHKGSLSAIITCFGLSLLLRSDTLWVHPLAAAFAISSKFMLRIDGKHLYNPANLGVILGLSFFPGTWVSPGQWGNDVALAGWFVALGGLVTQRARRWDIAWVFLAGWFSLVAARVLSLGQPWPILAHQLGNGGLLLFAFFMISDPMTIPARRSARVGYALFVALVAFVWQFALFRTNALMWALFIATPLVPIVNRLWPSERFQWRPAPHGELP
jgi:Na+-transporting NADH:ubiquinone oxidoreductase subunit NqrB